MGRETTIPELGDALQAFAGGGIDPAPRPREQLQRVMLVKNVVAAGMLAGLLLSPNLWLSSRSYPLSPIWARLPAIAPPVDLIWYAALVFLLFYIVVQPRARWSVLWFVFLAALLSLADQSRWQPWFYQYLFMLLPLGLYPWAARGTGGNESEATVQRVLNPCRLIVAATYLHSGLQKLNMGFLDETGPWLLEPVLKSLPPSFAPPLHAGIIAVPIVEVLIGVGLLFRYAPLAVVGAILMHLLIFWSIGPLGRSWNTIVWPWNLAIIVLVPALFWRAGSITVKSALLGERRSVYPKLVLLLFGIMPFFSLVGLWDKYLSASLYSGRLADVMLDFGPSVFEHLPPVVRQECSNSPRGRFRLSLMAWSLAEMNVPEYPEDRIYRNAARALAQWTDGTPEDSVILMIRRLPQRDGTSASEVLLFTRDSPP